VCAHTALLVVVNLHKCTTQILLPTKVIIFLIWKVAKFHTVTITVYIPALYAY